MACTTYACWIADGRPWSDCQPTRDFIAMLYRHGYTGPKVGLGDLAHQTANPPEDHTAFSHTPWPGPQPYPRILAIDIMPGFGIDVVALSGHLFDDKSSGVPGLAPLKYMNWTDTDNNCWHDSWMPRHTRFRSTDRGHLHISWRTDYVNSTLLATYDPFGSTPPPQEDDEMGMHFVAVDGDSSIYLAPGYAAPSGRMAAYGLDLDSWNRYKSLNLSTVTMIGGDALGRYYDTNPQPWPTGSSTPADHTHPVASSTTGPAEPV